MVINGDYLYANRKRFGLSEQQAAEILQCTRDEIIYYETRHTEPLESHTAENLITFVKRRELDEKVDTKLILQGLLDEIRRIEPYSFSPDKLLAHPKKIVELVTDQDGHNVKPFLIEVHLTNECDHNCPGCTFTHIRHDTSLCKEKLTKESVSTMLEELQPTNFGVRAIFWSGGGEPLLHEHAQEIFEHAAHLGFKQILITNGSNLDRIDPGFIVEHFSTVRISVDATTDIAFGKTHGFKSDDASEKFLEVQSNIRKLVEVYKKKTASNEGINEDIRKVGIGVSFLLQPANKDEVASFCNIARKSLGVNYVELKPLVLQQNHKNDRMISELVTPDLVDSLRFARKNDGQRADFKILTLEHKLLDMLSERYGKTFEKCWGHPLYPAIAANGGVYPCCLMIGKEELCYGNVNELSFSEIWDSQLRRDAVGRIDAPTCPINCKLSETNKILERVNRALAAPLRDYIN